MLKALSPPNNNKLLLSAQPNRSNLDQKQKQQVIFKKFSNAPLVVHRLKNAKKLNSSQQNKPIAEIKEFEIEYNIHEVNSNSQQQEIKQEKPNMK